MVLDFFETFRRSDRNRSHSGKFLNHLWSSFFYKIRRKSNSSLNVFLDKFQKKLRLVWLVSGAVLLTFLAPYEMWFIKWYRVNGASFSRIKNHYFFLTAAGMTSFKEIELVDIYCILMFVTLLSCPCRHKAFNQPLLFLVTTKTFSCTGAGLQISSHWLRLQYVVVFLTRVCAQITSLRTHE